jgi:hypothetical protein
MANPRFYCIVPSLPGSPNITIAGYSGSVIESGQYLTMPVDRSGNVGSLGDRVLWRGLMAIVDDFSGIAAELRRIQTERLRHEKRADDAAPLSGRPAPILDPDHPMRRTAAGDLLYRRLVRPRRRSG